MVYKLSLKEIPIVKQFYTVTRNTVWQICDPFHILISVTDGMCDIELDGEAYRLCAGDIFYIPKGHSYLRRHVDFTMCTMTYIHFDTSEEADLCHNDDISTHLHYIKSQIERSYLETDLLDTYPTDVYLDNKTTLDNFEECLERLQKINLFSTGRPLMCHLQSSVILSELLVSLSQRTTERYLRAPALEDADFIPGKLKRAISYIMRHYTEHINLDDLSRVCSVSKQQLIRYFKSTLNTTPIRYLLDYRLSRAKELLFAHPDLSVKEIAYELGFDNPHYFTRAFTEKNGESPRAYRSRTVNFNPEERTEKK